MLSESQLRPIKQRYAIVGDCPALNRALDVAVQIAPTDLSVLIEGENGVGKEVFPRLIHDHSPRKHKKYFAINCGSIPEGTIDSELFGHEKGSFTGALSEHEGYFAAANGGTLFLDEVGELPLSTQVRLLRVLETGEYLRVGSNEVKKTDVRIIAATNVRLPQAIRQGKFREDLYYRLAAIPITIPPLRERGDDVLLLFRKFAADIAERYRLEPVTLDDDAKHLMRSYKWPGNIRQLKNLTEQLSILSETRTISAAALADYGLTDDDAAAHGLVLSNPSVRGPHSYENEREMLLRQLFALGQEVKEIKEMIAEGRRTAFANPADGRPSREPALAPRPTWTQAEIETLEPMDLSDERLETADGSSLDTPALGLKDQTERSIREALRRNQGNRKLAAQELGISERTIYRKIRELGIDS